MASITYFVIENSDGRFSVMHRDENGEAWDADSEGFDTREEAEAYRDEVQDMQDSATDA